MDSSTGSPVTRSLVHSLRVIVIMTLLTGVAYPAVVSLAALAFPGQAGGSLIERNGQVVGSRLIGQPFSSPGYFWPRPSATTPVPYDAAASTPSNLGPTNGRLVNQVREREKALEAANPTAEDEPPVDLVTASASGLDPDISPAAALYQVPRVAKARALPEETVRRLALDHIQGRQLGVFGEPRVNVLELNLALDAMRP